MILDYSYDRSKARMLTSKLTEDDLPVDPLLLTKKIYNVDLFYDDLEGEEGYTFYDEKRNRYRIYIDKNYKITRRNFTVAHEVGHIVMGHFLNFDVCDQEVHKILDSHANAFASALLMPEHILTKFDQLNIKYILNAFDVSKEAFDIRLNYVKINVI